MSKYQQIKETIRSNAINWQDKMNKGSTSYDVICYYGAYWERLARRYGLIKEFRENGII